MTVDFKLVKLGFDNIIFKSCNSADMIQLRLWLKIKGIIHLTNLSVGWMHNYRTNCFWMCLYNFDAGNYFGCNASQ